MRLTRIAGYSAVAVLTLGSGMVHAQAGRTLSGALAGYTSGSPLDRRPLVLATEYASSTYYSGRYGSLASPIFMTTLNTPGIYGAYSFGVAPLTYDREPLFTPAYDPRQVIPAITITLPPVRDSVTAVGAATLSAYPPPFTPPERGYPATGYDASGYAVPGYATLSTIPRQSPAMSTRSTTMVPSDYVARVVVRVPEDARLEFGGVTVEQPGRIRKFTTPALTPGQKYSYDIRAVWTEGNRPVVKERTIIVYAGEKADIDFLSPEFDEAPRELRTQPLPAPNVAPVTPVPNVGPLKPTVPPARP
jgi:uncharacterized protein (TIGR03000 family)